MNNFRPHSSGTLVGVMLFALSAASCGGAAGSATSTVSGQLDLGSFPSAVGHLVLRARGADTPVSIDASGRFSATVRAGLTYELITDQGIPVVVHATRARLDPTFHVRSGGSALKLGQVHYVNGLVHGALAQTLPISNPASSCSGSEGDGEHPDEGDGQDAQQEGGHRDGATSSEAASEGTDCKESDAMGIPDQNLPDVVGCDESDDGDQEEADAED